MWLEESSFAAKGEKMKLLRVFLFCVFLCSGAAKLLQAEPARYIVAVAPQYSPVATYESWKPFVDYLSGATGTKFELKVVNSVAKFENDIMTEVFDFAYMSPYYQVKAKEHYVPLVHDGSAKLTGILVVRNDDPAQSIKELSGEKFAVPSVNAIGASLYPRALLEASDGISIVPVAVKTHDNVYRHVILRKTRLGGGVRGTFKKQPIEIQEQLRVIYETPGITPHPFSAHRQIPQPLREAVLEAILNLGKTEEGQKILKDIAIPLPVAANYEQDYQELEKLNLDKYWVKESKE